MSAVQFNQLSNNVFTVKSVQENVRESVLKSKLDPLEKMEIFEFLNEFPAQNRDEFCKKVMAEIEKGQAVTPQLIYSLNKSELSPEAQQLSKSISDLINVIDLQRKILFAIMGQPDSSQTIVKPCNNTVPQARKLHRARSVRSKIPNELKRFTPPPKEEKPIVESLPAAPSVPCKRTSTVKKRNKRAHGKTTGKTKPRNRKNSTEAVKAKAAVAERREICKVRKTDLPSQPIPRSPSEIRKIFFDKLTNLRRRQKKWRILPRVQRWQTENIAQMRLFEDKIDGRIVKQYEFISDEELTILRAKHYLPETERLLCKHYRKIYAIPTEKGYGVVAKFTTSNGITEEGMLFFGCDNKHKVYHRFFEKGAGDEHHFKGVESAVEYDSDEEETMECNQKVAISEHDGIIVFDYGDYQLEVYPVDREALDKEVPKMN